jgi:cysteinyl-tRNA synthetase
MSLKFYNTLTRKKEAFKPIKKGQVLMYTCGPTVYSAPHIGNYRSFLVADLLRRYLEFRGFQVKHAMNITDIDDKTIRDSAKENLTLKEFTEKYTKIFFDGLDKLNIKRAFKYPRATEEVENMIKMTRGLIEKGYAYGTSDGVYFDISKFKNYGKLSKIDLSKIKLGTTVSADEYAKDSPQDFALMKKSTTEELKRGIFYKTEWGNVRPGWHIECSTMSMKYLGETLDIHTGGVDLIFPHHENEIAQSEAYSGKKFVNYWMHAEHLIVEGQKMAKSLGNFVTLDDLLEKGYDPKAIRYLLLSTHYKQQLNFTFNGLEAAKKTVDSLFDFIKRLNEIKDGKSNPKINSLINAVRNDFVKSMDDNLSITVALASIFDFVKKINKLIGENSLSKKDGERIVKLMLDLDRVLGLGLEIKEEKLSAEIEKLIQERQEARKAGDFEKADEIRTRLEKEYDVILEDTKDGVRWKKVG